MAKEQSYSESDFLLNDICRGEKRAGGNTGELIACALMVAVCLTVQALANLAQCRKPIPCQGVMS